MRGALQPRGEGGSQNLFQALGLSKLDGRRAMALVAHPDDETIGLGGHLSDLPGFVIVHVTDGAPRNMRDATAHGFIERGAYAQARRDELIAAVAEAGIDPRSLLSLGIADQEASLHLASLARRVAELFESRQPQAVFTHAYEGGHPDHDAAAFAASAARRLIESRGGRPPALIDMPFYHSDHGRMVAQVFTPTPAAPSYEAALGQPALAIKQAMIARYVTQREQLRQFQTSIERFRLAPDYDFARLPNEGDLYYERFPWGLDGASWLKLAPAALAELGLSP
jgi:LmbE family N-acetylglucosaminyl deacetylase